ncbi:type IV secretory system conjugative DNA transfer family protein [Belnapia sp. F-4-1]|uniref:type IV secretory system conjugative DNA transfer family protein n=1 Tax=Belnapia sp. F-4-1 TaxID=1545443 RepID=UPI0005BD0603|nr:hypothetical protein [Belnapia sp. F-4-1]
MAAYVTKDDTPLLRFGGERWNTRDALEHVFIAGATGSGKTSASGKTLAHAYLRAGWGGLVLCAKPGEADLWERYCHETGRSRSLIRFDGSGTRLFNFLRYAAAAAQGRGGVSNVAALMTTVLQAANGNVSQGQNTGNPFWEKAVKECITHAFAVLWAAYGDLTLSDLMRLLHSRPKGPGQVDDPAFQQGFMGQTLAKAFEAPAYRMPAADFDLTHDYLTRVLPNPDPRTTGNLVQSLSADLAPLMSGPMRELFGTGLNLLPELTHEGAVLVMDFPLKEWNEAGKLAQHIMKYCWQRATERRAVDAGTRPVFLWVDEAQFFVSPYDAEFLSTARSARAAVVYLTQNLPALYEQIGGRSPQHVAGALLGHFRTKIWHANDCPTTNQAAADTIGKALQRRRSIGASGGESDGDSSGESFNEGGGGTNQSRNKGRNRGSSLTVQEMMDYRVQPSRFLALRTGGRPHRGRVDAILFKSARQWRATQAEWLPVEFRQ